MATAGLLGGMPRGRRWRLGGYGGGCDDGGFCAAVTVTVAVTVAASARRAGFAGFWARWPLVIFAGSMYPALVSL